VTNFAVIVPDGDQLAKAKINYNYNRKSGRFDLKSDRVLPNLAVRIGPYTQKTAEKYAEKLSKPCGATVRVEASGNADGQAAWWVWVENMKDIETLKLSM